MQILQCMLNSAYQQVSKSRPGPYLAHQLQTKIPKLSYLLKNVESVDIASICFQSLF